MLLDYLVKVEKLKMHVNTTSAFNVNYKIAVTLTVPPNVLVNHINEHSGQSMRSKCPPPACTHDLRWSCQHRYVPVKVKTSLHQAFSQAVDVMNLCFTHTLLYNTPNK